MLEKGKDWGSQGRVLPVVHAICEACEMAFLSGALFIYF